MPTSTVLSLPRWRRFPLPWAAAFLVAVLPLYPSDSTGLWPSDAPSHPASAHEGGETPDCGPLSPDPDPLHQRSLCLARLGVERWHAAGQLGRGVKVAILDSGFRGYRQQLGKALPAQVRTQSFRLDGNLEAKDSQHGILCAEVIHALAPAAELLLANWESDQPAQFLAAIRWARQQGARVISCSVIMPSWSDGEGNGSVHEGMARLLGTGDSPEDLLLFASAGNIAERHWAGRYHEGASHFHEWAPNECDNLVFPWGSDDVSVELCWQPGADYALSVYDTLTGNAVGRTTAYQEKDRCCAVVRVTPESGKLYRVRVQQRGGKPGSFHLVSLGGGLRYATTPGSIPFPGDGPEVIAVGAVDDSGQRASYSSCGPNSRQPKPDLVATVPFPSLWRPRPFSGTSAAAPQAAGLAALVCARHPDWTAKQVRDFLCASAEDLGPLGHDYETGYGQIKLPW